MGHIVKNGFWYNNFHSLIFFFNVKWKKKLIYIFIEAKDWNRAERVKEKERKKRTLFKGNESEAVFFVDATPESDLADKCRKEFQRSSLKVKVVERSGRSVKRTLVKSNSFKKLGCNTPKCPVCALGGEIHCKSREDLYRISCIGIDTEGNPCVDVNYEGETSRSLGERFGGHMRMIRSMANRYDKDPSCINTCGKATTEGYRRWKSKSWRGSLDI